MIWYALLFFALLLGQILRFETLGAAVMGLDLVIFFLFIRNIFSIKNFIFRKEEKIIPPLSLFILIALLSLFIYSFSLTSGQTIISLLYLVRFILYCSIYFITKRYIAKQQISKNFLNNGLLLAGLGVALLGFIQLIFYPDIRNLYYLGWDPHFGRLVSTTFDPNFTGIILVMAFFLSLNQIIFNKNKKRIFYFIVSIILFIALVFTYSRSSYLALTIGLLSWGALQNKVKYSLVFITILALAIFIVPKPQGEGGKLTRTSTTSARVTSWYQSVILWRKSPVIGFGFNTLAFVKEKYQLLPLTNNSYPNHAAAGADNSLLFVLLTTGLVGLGSFCWLIWEIFKKLSFDKVYLPFFSSVLIHSLFQNTLFFPQVLVFLFLVLTLIPYGRFKKVQNI